MFLVFIVLPVLIALINAQHIQKYCGVAKRNASIPGELNVTMPETKVGKVECVWELFTRPGMKVELSVLKIQLNDSSRCLENFLDIYLGDTTKQAAYDRLCCLSGGRSKVYVSTGYVMYLHLIMQTYAKGDGIFAIYNDVTGISPYQHDSDICGNEDIVVSKFSGLWAIPLYGMEARNKQCRWILIADIGKKVQLTFKDITFDNDAACNTNNILITDGVYENETQLGTICNMQAKKTDFISSSRYLFVKFVALNISAGKGFTAEIRQLNNARKIALSEIWIAVLLMALRYNYY